MQVREYNGAHLPLNKISRMDMAAYLCIARNGVPPIVSKRIQVSVDFPPMMSIPHQLVGAPLGYSITLECTIEAHPPALTYWTLGQGVMLHHGRKYHISERVGDVSYRTHMKLTIKSLRKNEDYGSYRCVAKNSRGETEGLIKLYETDPPTPAPTSPPSYLDKLFKDIHFKTNSISGKGEDDKLFGNHFEEGPDREYSAVGNQIEEEHDPFLIGGGEGGRTGSSHMEDRVRTEEESRLERGRTPDEEQGQYYTNMFNDSPAAAHPSSVWPLHLLLTVGMIRPLHLLL
ncbi:lachesin-like [Macrobrachium nipponense]|uniref:lachesin-like n=1 Tax=Macrobrachium nipponense TaxID=159736 RepID=UPI0030C838A5